VKEVLQERNRLEIPVYSVKAMGGGNGAKEGAIFLIMGPMFKRSENIQPERRPEKRRGNGVGFDILIG